jgi:hypothetical protein
LSRRVRKAGYRIAARAILAHGKRTTVRNRCCCGALQQSERDIRSPIT